MSIHGAKGKWVNKKKWELMILEIIPLWANNNMPFAHTWFINVLKLKHFLVICYWGGVVAFPNDISKLG